MGTDLLTNPWVYGPFALLGFASTCAVVVLVAVFVQERLGEWFRVRREVRHLRRDMRQFNRRNPAWMREGL